MPGWTRNFLPHGFSLSCGSTTFLAVGFHSPNHTQIERIKEKATKAAGHCGVQSSQQRAVPGRVPKVFGSLAETATGRSYLQHRRQPKEPTTHAWALASNILSTSREMHTPLAAPHSDLHLLWGPGMCAPAQPCLGDSCPNPCPPNQVKITSPARHAASWQLQHKDVFGLSLFTLDYTCQSTGRMQRC